MTAPRVCEHCGAALDAGEICDCVKEEETMAMEFVMATDLETLPKTIDFNFEQLKQQLSASLELYTGMVVTEDGIKGAKEDRARLNKLREALESKRKEVKNQCMAPYTDFEAKVKELVYLVDQPIGAIDGQLRAFEEKRRAEKRAEVLTIYLESVGKMQELLPFDRLWQDSWYNKGATIKKIKEEIDAAVKKVSSDLDILSTVESEFSEAVKIKYLERLDLNEALAERARLQERSRKLREYEEQQKRAAAAQEELVQTPASDPNQIADEPAEPPQEAAEGREEQVYLLRFECQLTLNQAAELSAWLKSNNINYRRIK